MAWIRFDCSTLDNDFVINLSGDEFKSWTLFLLRCKALGARGSVPVTSLENLSRNWNVPVAAIKSMLEKAGDRIVEDSGRWYVTNWHVYQEDFRPVKTKNVSPEKTGDTSDAATVQYPTPTRTITPTEERAEKPQNSPSLVQVIDYFVRKGYIDPPAEGEKFFNYYSGIGWAIRGNPIKNWMRFADSWQKKSKEWKEKKGGKINDSSTGKYTNVAD